MAQTNIESTPLFTADFIDQDNPLSARNADNFFEVALDYSHVSAGYDTQNEWLVGYVDALSEPITTDPTDFKFDFDDDAKSMSFIQYSFTELLKSNKDSASFAFTRHLQALKSVNDMQYSFGDILRHPGHEDDGTQEFSDVSTSLRALIRNRSSHELENFAKEINDSLNGLTKIQPWIIASISNRSSIKTFAARVVEFKKVESSDILNLVPIVLTAAGERAFLPEDTTIHADEGLFFSERII